jgi:uracil-DNA glycosylase family 4
VNKKEKQEKLERVIGQIAKCKRCALHSTRTNTVPGEGDIHSKLMFIGEAPGSNEDKQGRPFVGRAGSVLDELLTSIQLKREDVYICNILKCRPPNNRNPLSDEIAACVGSLDIQIKIINPKVIATLGNFATMYILNKFNLETQKISAVSGKVFHVQTPEGTRTIIPLFHPAVVTYNPSKKDVLKKDFQAVKSHIY